MQTISVIEAARRLIRERLREASCIVDATAGNGYDTLYFALHSPANVKIYAFDIQQGALDATREKLKQASLEHKVELILSSHAKLRDFIAEEIDLAIFNLGYLPGGDHTVTTLAESTVEALAQTVERLRINGLIAVIAYPGHEAGACETQRLEEYLSALPARQFTAGRYSMINHIRTSPVLYLIEKVRG